MASTGVKTVRFSGFSWSEIEPREGIFDFSWLDELISAFAHYGFEIIMCIPTERPPFWLYEKHPEIMQTDSDGKKKSFCINSSVFLGYAERITDEMTRHCTSHPSVKIWNIVNETPVYGCCCDNCRDGFRKWLTDRYDTLENINKVFGNNMHSGNYSNINQVQLPLLSPENYRNPALCMEYYRYTHDITDNYIKNLSSIIKRQLPKTKITTNICFNENTPDFFCSQTDYVSYYRSPVPENNHDTFELDLMRSIRGSNFIVTERQNDELSLMSPTVKPGQIRGYALQTIAHGAETVINFRWRSPVSGAGMNHSGILDCSNIPKRVFFEFEELCKTVSKLNFVQTSVISDIAILYSPESEYAFRVQPQSEGFSYREQIHRFYDAFSSYGANIDFVLPESDLSGYKIVVAPALYVNNKTTTENIYRFVINGGTFVMTNRSGVKGADNNCIMDTLPTVFKELIGAEVTESDPIGNTELEIVDFAGKKFICSKWCDVLQLHTARAYAEYSNNFYRGCPAITVNKYCKGIAYYVGTICGADFYEDFAGKLMHQNGIPKLKGLPDGVEVTTRTNGVDDYIFFFNNSDKNVSIRLPKAMYSIIDTTGKDTIDLKPFSIDVVRK
jgi:beta-galactosidase